jgi:uncharacterized protein YjbI with pentapeptide repeats
MNLNGLRLNGADFMGADLSEAKMNFIQLGVVTLDQLPFAATPELPIGNRADEDQFPPDVSGPIGSGFDLQATPSATNLGGAKLCRAQLRAADLRGANLAYANLAEADLTSADLRRANLLHTDLSRTRVEVEQVRNSIHDDTTKWPPGFTPPGVDPVDEMLRETLQGNFNKTMDIFGISQTAKCP